MTQDELTFVIAPPTLLQFLRTDASAGRIGYLFGGQTQYTTRRTELSQYLAAACGVVYGRGGAQLS